MSKGTFLGTTGDGLKVYVTASLTPLTGTGTSIDHEPVTGGYRFSMQGSTYERGREVSGGQIVEAVEAIEVPARGWTADEVAEVASLWRRWHLNDMKAGCSHQQHVVRSTNPRYGYPEVDLDGTTNHPHNACPEGYRYGSAWLVEPLTPEALASIEALLSRLEKP